MNKKELSKENRDTLHKTQNKKLDRKSYRKLVEPYAVRDIIRNYKKGMSYDEFSLKYLEGEVSGKTIQRLVKRKDNEKPSKSYKDILKYLRKFDNFEVYLNHAAETFQERVPVGKTEIIYDRVQAIEISDTINKLKKDSKEKLVNRAKKYSGDIQGLAHLNMYWDLLDESPSLGFIFCEFFEFLIDSNTKNKKGKENEQEFEKELIHKMQIVQDQIIYKYKDINEENSFDDF